jgi:hypothetical protein
MVFVEPKLGVRLSLGMDPQLWTGALSLIVFFLSIVQFKSDWKEIAEAHAKSFEEYAKVKSDCRALRKTGRQITGPDCERVRARYDLAQELGTPIPEAEFLGGKAHHLRKVFISRYLDTHPGASIWVVRAKLLLRDNLNIHLFGSDEPKTEK